MVVTDSKPYYAKGRLLCSEKHHRTHVCWTPEQAKDLADRMNKSVDRYEREVKNGKKCDD